MILIDSNGTFKLRQATYNYKEIKNWYVSNTGFLYNIKTNKYKFGHDNVKNKDLHQRVSIKHKLYYMHRIVAEAWVENPDKNVNVIVRHLDDNPRNNFYKNLKWGTPKQNTHDAIKNGKIVYDENRNYTKNENHPQAILTNKQVYEIIDYLNSSIKLSEIAKLYGVGVGVIRHIYTGNSWKDLTKDFLPFPEQKVYNPPSDHIKEEIINHLLIHPDAKPSEIIKLFNLENSDSIRGFIGNMKRKINKNRRFND